MTGWKRMLWTVALVFAVTFITQLLASGALDVWNTSASTWQQAANSAVAGVLALIVNYAAPWIQQYGIGKAKT